MAGCATPYTIRTVTVALVRRRLREAGYLAGQGRNPRLLYALCKLQSHAISADIDNSDLINAIRLVENISHFDFESNYLRFTRHVIFTGCENKAKEKLMDHLEKILENGLDWDTVVSLLISVSVLAEQCYTVNSNRMVDIVEWFMTEASICGIGNASINRWLEFKGGFEQLEKMPVGLLGVDMIDCGGNTLAMIAHRVDDIFTNIKEMAGTPGKGKRRSR